jgi:hypothetical protein
MTRGNLHFPIEKNCLADVLSDRGLASLGDAYVNFVFSLALSDVKHKPLGVRVKGSLLAEALRKAELRNLMGSRMSRHELADAAEALLVYGWLNNCLALDECVKVLTENRDLDEGLRILLERVKKKATFP